MIGGKSGRLRTSRPRSNPSEMGVRHGGVSEIHRPPSLGGEKSTFEFLRRAPVSSFDSLHYSFQHRLLQPKRPLGNAVECKVIGAELMVSRLRDLTLELAMRRHDLQTRLPSSLMAFLQLLTRPGECILFCEYCDIF